MSFFRTFGFRSILVGFLVGQEGHTSQCSDLLVAFRRPNSGREYSLFSSLNLTDIPYNGHSHKILQLVYVQYVLTFCPKVKSFENCCHICPKNGLNLTTGWLFTGNSTVQYTDVIVVLKLSTNGTNVTTMFCMQRKNI